MQKNDAKFVAFFVILMLLFDIFIVFGNAQEENYIIDGDTISLTTDVFELSTTPHTLKESGDVTFTFELFDATYDNTDIDVFWLFDRSDCLPKRSNYTGNINHQTVSWNGWTDLYYIQDVTVRTDKFYSLSAYINVIINSQGKYCYGFKKSSVTWQQAIQNGENHPNGYYIIDPWWNTSYSYNKYMTITNPHENDTHQLIIGYDNTCPYTENVQLDSHCQTDFDDLRLVRLDNVTEIPIFYDYVENSEVAIIWFKNIYNDSKLILYYGNPTATRNNDPDHVFYRFDDWYNGNITDYTIDYRKDYSSYDGVRWYRQSPVYSNYGKGFVMNYSYQSSDFHSQGERGSLNFCEQEPTWDTTLQSLFGYYMTNDNGDSNPDGNVNDIAVYEQVKDDGSNTKEDITDPPLSDLNGNYLRSINYVLFGDSADSDTYSNNYLTTQENYQIVDGNVPDLKNDCDWFFYQSGNSQESDADEIYFDTDHLTLYGNYNVELNISVYWVGFYNITNDDTTFAFSGETEYIPCECLLTNIYPQDQATNINCSLNITVDVNSTCGIMDYVNISLTCPVCGLINYTNFSASPTNDTFWLNVSNLSSFTTYTVYYNTSCDSVINNTITNFTTGVCNITGGCGCDDIQDIIEQALKDYDALKEGDTITINIGIEQFEMLFMLVLFVIFVWIGYTIPSLETSQTKKTWRMIPFSGGMFMLFAGLDFIGLTYVISSYTLPVINGFLGTVGIIIILYGIIKGFYY